MIGKNRNQKFTSKDVAMGCVGGVAGALAGFVLPIVLIPAAAVNAWMTPNTAPETLQFLTHPKNALTAGFAVGASITSPVFALISGAAYIGTKIMAKRFVEKTDGRKSK